MDPKDRLFHVYVYLSEIENQVRDLRSDLDRDSLLLASSRLRKILESVGEVNEALVTAALIQKPPSQNAKDASSKPDV